MKKSVIFAIAVLGLAVSACLGESYYSPVSYYTVIDIRFKDSTSVSRLDTTKYGNWGDSAFYCMFQGKKYVIDNVDDKAGYGFVRTNYIDRYYGRIFPVVYFGVFEGSKDMEDSLFFFWPDKSQDTVAIHNKLTWAKSGKGVTNQESWVKHDSTYRLPVYPITIRK